MPTATAAGYRHGHGATAAADASFDMLFVKQAPAGVSRGDNASNNNMFKTLKTRSSHICSRARFAERLI
jgi:hypothetical protein